MDVDKLSKLLPRPHQEPQLKLGHVLPKTSAPFEDLVHHEEVAGHSYSVKKKGEGRFPDIMQRGKVAWVHQTRAD